MKQCPICAEEIQDAALVCRHCGATATPTGWTRVTSAGEVFRTNGLAIASMVLGILWIYWIGSVLAVIFGYVARRQIRNSMGAQRGAGMAMAGIVLGWVGIGFLAFVFVVILVGVSTSSDTTIFP